MAFQRATKAQARLRMAIDGPSGSGKTFSSLAIASHLGKKIAVIDTERGSASKYADLFTFDVDNLDAFGPDAYMRAIREAGGSGYDVLVIDSLSHAWFGKGGCLEQADIASTRPGANRFTAWRGITPQHNALVDEILQSPCHVIATMRTKTEYVVETNDRGKQVPRKVGLAPVQRDGMEYEFDVVGDMDLEHRLFVSKTRCMALDGQVYTKPGADIAGVLRAWLENGEPAGALPPKSGADFATLYAELIAKAEACADKEELRRIYCEFPADASQEHKLLWRATTKAAADRMGGNK
jgi:hypothetical protein